MGHKQYELRGSHSFQLWNTGHIKSISQKMSSQVQKCEWATNSMSFGFLIRSNYVAHGWPYEFNLSNINPALQLQIKNPIGPTNRR